jgi:hypothetical protein
LAQVLGGRIISFPMKYLGLPLGARYEWKEIWNPVLEKMEKRLAGWKIIYLSNGSRLTLIFALYPACQHISYLYSPFRGV